MREAIRALTAAPARDGPPFGEHPGWVAEPSLYLGQPERALARFDALRRSGRFATLQLFALDRVTCPHLFIRTCLALARDNPERRSTWLAPVEREARKLRRERMRYAPAVVAQAHAGIAIQRGDATAALRELERAARVFAAEGMRHDAAAARDRIGKLAQGEAGARLVAEARAEAAALGISNPDRMFRSLVTGFPG